MTFPVVGAIETEPQGCKYALCIFGAEYQVSLPNQPAIVVCCMHVQAVIEWGWTGETDDFPRIDRLAS